MKPNFKLYDVPHITSIQNMVLQSSEKFNSKLALEDLINTPINRLNYDELLENILKFGAALKSLGINERAHIAIIAENRVQWALSYLTIMCFNYVAVPIDRNLTENEILNIIHESDSEVIIFSENFSSLFDEHKISLKKIKHYICMDHIKSDSDILIMKNLIDEIDSTTIHDLPKIDTNEIAEIIFTSGSLGRAKGVMLSQKNISFNLEAMVKMLFIFPEDRFLSVLPMHHSYECTCGMLCPLYCGASVHYARSLKTVVDDIKKMKATILLGVPLLFDKMFKRISKAIKDDKVKSIVVPALVKITDFADKISSYQLKRKIFNEIHDKFGGHIRIFIAGGAAPDPLVAKGLREFGFNFIQGYGLTETSPILTLNRLDYFKDNAAGIPLPGIEVKIDNPDENGSGEIWAKGESIMMGYYKNDKFTKEVFSEGWFKTGDIGYFDSDGFLHINGRMKNVIISRSGKNVFPEEIEDVLNRSPFILESIVYGEEDSKQDEVIAAQIVVDSESFIEYSESKGLEINEAMINKIIDEEIKECNKQLATYKRVAKFNIRDNEFEKTTTKKIKRYLIKN